MGKCESTIKKVLFVLDEDATQCYVAVEARGDCPVGVQGWHHKSFPPSVFAVDILKGELFDYLLWPLNAPTNDPKGVMDEQKNQYQPAE